MIFETLSIASIFPFLDYIFEGSKNLKDNVLEVKSRKTGKVKKISPQETLNFVINQFNNII